MPLVCHQRDDTQALWSMDQFEVKFIREMFEHVKSPPTSTTDKEAATVRETWMQTSKTRCSLRRSGWSGCIAENRYELLADRLRFPDSPPWRRRSWRFSATF